MKMLRLGLALGMTVLLAAGARAQDASQLAQGKGCMGCHAVDQKKVGPSFKDVAAKYKGQSDAAAKLTAELKNGTGHMKIGATDAELQQLIAYVLATP
ncbi:MAG: c-type cytochrome [Tepidisphaerales bacterium]